MYSLPHCLLTCLPLLPAPMLLRAGSFSMPVDQFSRLLEELVQVVARRKAAVHVPAAAHALPVAAAAHAAAHVV